MRRKCRRAVEAFDVLCFALELLHRGTTFPLGRLVATGLRVVHRVASTTDQGGLLAVEGGVMELRMRLNVLAAIVSFGFLAAIVLGAV